MGFQEGVIGETVDVESLFRKEVAVQRIDNRFKFKA